MSPTREPDNDLTTIEEYFVAEKLRERRHEFVDGLIFERQDATFDHNRINLSLLYYLHEAAHNEHCFLSNSMVRLRAAENIVYYADAMATCDRSDDDAYIVNRPCFAAEVMSPSTEMTDRREKAMIYRAIPSMRTILLIYEERREVIHFERGDDGSWTRHLLNDGTIEIPCLQTSITIDQIYERVPD